MNSIRRRENSDRPNSLGISQAVLDALLERLETTSRSQAAVARGAVRVPFRRLSVAFTVLHSDGTAAHMTVACRNLSRGGVGILHAAYMHVGTSCQVHLPRSGRPDATVPGVVVRCRHVGGRVHEIGVKFHELIDPKDYVSATPEDVRRVLDSIKPAEFSCKVMLWIADDATRRNITRLLTGTRATVIEHDVRKTEPPQGDRADVMICELPPENADVSETLVRLAEFSQGAPVVMVAGARDTKTKARLAQFLPDSTIFLPLELVGICRSMAEAITFSTR